MTDLILLRDRLAHDRTVLANERTLLAYVRTSLTLFIVGMSFIHIPLFDSAWFIIQGWIFIPLGVITFFLGLFRFQKIRKKLRQVQQGWPAGK